MFALNKDNHNCNVRLGIQQILKKKKGTQVYQTFTLKSCNILNKAISELLNGETYRK